MKNRAAIYLFEFLLVGFALTTGAYAQHSMAVDQVPVDNTQIDAASAPGVPVDKFGRHDGETAFEAPTAKVV